MTTLQNTAPHSAIPGQPLQTSGNTSTQDRRLMWGIGILILVIYALLLSVLFAQRNLSFDSDEAVHAIEGLQLAADLRSGQIGAFVSHLYFHYWYPPLLSLYLTPFILIWGPAYWAARYASLALFLVNLALLYQVGRLLGRRRETGVAAAVLGATSPVFWILALQCMEETIATTGLLLVIAGYTLAVRKRLNWFWTGLALAITFLARTSMGAFAAGALMAVIWIRRGTLKEKAAQTLRALGPAAATMLIWWAHPYKWQGLADYFLASSPRAASITWAVLTNYWNQLLTTDVAGWVIGLLVIAAIFSALLGLHKPEPRFLLALFFITWAALVFKRQLAVRLFFTALPPAFLLTAHQSVLWAGQIWRRFFRRAQWIGYLLFISLGVYVCAAGAVRALTFPFLMEVSYETDPTSEEARAWIAEQSGHGRIFMVNTWDQFSAPAMDWYLAGLHWPQWESQVTGVDLSNPEKHPDKVIAFQQAMLAARASTLIHIENAPVPEAGAWWAYQAALAECWNGEWAATSGFWIRIWDGQLAKDILAHPAHFLTPEQREAARQAFWYPLLIQVHVATCK